jgi:hypothetical protein
MKRGCLIGILLAAVCFLLADMLAMLLLDDTLVRIIMQAWDDIVDGQLPDIGWWPSLGWWQGIVHHLAIVAVLLAAAALLWNRRLGARAVRWIWHRGLRAWGQNIVEVAGRLRPGKGEGLPLGLRLVAFGPMASSLGALAVVLAHADLWGFARELLAYVADFRNHVYWGRLPWGAILISGGLAWSNTYLAVGLVRRNAGAWMVVFVVSLVKVVVSSAALAYLSCHPPAPGGGELAGLAVLGYLRHLAIWGGMLLVNLPLACYLWLQRKQYGTPLQFGLGALMMLCWMLALVGSGLALLRAWDF